MAFGMRIAWLKNPNVAFWLYNKQNLLFVYFMNVL